MTASPTVSDEDDARAGRRRDPERASEGGSERSPEAAISSSAWKVRTPNCLSWASCSRTSDAGVIG